MSQRRLSDYLSLKEMGAGRHGFALKEVRGIADAMGLSGALPLIDAGIEKARAAQSLDFQWEGAKKKKSGGRGAAKKIKGEIGRQLTGIHSIVVGRTTGDADDPICKLAREFIADVFPNGVEGISGKKYELMQGTIATILRDQLEGPKAEHVTKLGIEREVARLKRLNEELRVELQTNRRKPLEFEDVEEARDEAHEATGRVVIAVLNQFNGDDEESERDRERVLAPINFQQGLVAEARSHHRQPTDVDLDTGEELDVVVDEEETNGSET